MEDQEEVAFQFQYHAFPEPAQSENSPTFRLRDRRIKGAQKKWRDDTDPLQGLSHEAGLKSFEIDDDIGQFGHGEPS